jgi:anti-anti-sigma factor
MSLFASTTREAHAPVVYLSGEIDLANVESHYDLLVAMVDACPAPELVVNCAHLELLEAQGMAMMRRVHTRGVEDGVAVVWRGLAPRHRHLLELVGLDRRLLLDPPSPPVRRRATPPR